MRGWLATSICGEGGRPYGLLQLRDKRNGGDFTLADEAHVRDLAPSPASRAARAASVETPIRHVVGPAG